jgi:hypothetical protein
MAEWFRRQGYAVERTESSWWVEVSRGVLQAFPYHWEVEPTGREIRKLLRERRAVALRYSAPLSTGNGKVSYHVVGGEHDLSLAALAKKARYDIRTGHRYAEIRAISFEFLAQEGWEIRKETLGRQGRTAAERRDWWTRMCSAADEQEAFEAWGALRGRELIASILTWTEDDVSSILYQQSASAHLQFGVNNALTHAFASEVFRRSPGSKVFYGVESLDAPSSVDEFKCRMGFVKRPVRQRVVFHPIVAPLVNGVSHGVLNGLKSRWPSNPTLAKAEGMVRFFREGRLPLARQAPPPGLSAVVADWGEDDEA